MSGFLYKRSYKRRTSMSNLDNLIDVSRKISGTENRYDQLVEPKKPNTTIEAKDMEIPPKPNMDGMGNENFEDFYEDGLDADIYDRGIDILAWYFPYHFNKKLWGIYYKDYGIIKVGKKVTHNMDRRIVTYEGYDVLKCHETFHHIVEIVGSLLEVTTQMEKYVTYNRDVYTKNRYSQQDHPLEEALANAWAYRFVDTEKRSPKLTDKAKLFNWMKRSPSGYNAFDNYITKRDFRRGERKLYSDMLGNGLFGSNLLQLETMRPTALSGLINYSTIPKYLCKTGKVNDQDYNYIFHFLKKHSPNIKPKDIR